MKGVEGKKKKRSRLWRLEKNRRLGYLPERTTQVRSDAQTLRRNGVPITDKVSSQCR